MAPLLESEGLRLRLVSRRRNKWLRMWDMLRAVWRYGRRESPLALDVYSTLNFYYAVAVASMCRLLRIPYVCVLHGGGLPGRLRRHPVLSRWVYGGARRLLAPSGYLRHAFAEAGYAPEVIPNFIRIGNYPYRERGAIRADGPRILWVRAFSRIYNPTMAVETLRLLRETHPEARLCMVGPDKGDGSRAACEARAQELGLSKYLTFTGALTKADWIALSAGYDVFINTTSYDNTPVSVVEAMALGFPIVSTDVGGLPWLLQDGHTALLTPDGDAGAMCAAIRRICEMPDLARALSRNARAEAERFDWEQVKLLWLEALEARR